MTPSRVISALRNGAQTLRGRLEILCLALVLLGLTLLGVWTIHPWLALQNSDGATYYLLAFNLAKQGSYLLHSLPTPEPVFSFPPLWPLIIAVVMKLLGSFQPLVVVPVLKWLTLGIYALSIALMFQLYQPHAGRGIALITALLMAVNAVAHRYMGDLLADIPYLLFSLVFLADFVAGTQQPGGPFAQRARALRLLTLLALAPMLRPVGLMLGAAASANELLDRRWKSALLALLASVSLYGGWLVAEHHLRAQHPAGDPALQAYVDRAPVKIAFLKYFATRTPGDEDHVAADVSLTTRVSDSLKRLEQYSRMASESLWPSGLEAIRLPAPARGLLLLLSLAFIGLGFWRAPAALRILGLYSACYTGLLLAYPYVSARYLLPILPWITAAYFMGLAGALSLLVSRFRAGRQAFAASITAALMLIMALIALTTQLQAATPIWARSALTRVAGGGPRTNTAHAALLDALFFLKTAQDHGQLSPDTVLIARKPEVAFFYTGVHARRFPFYENPDRLFAWLRATGGANVLILEDSAFKESRRLLSPALAAQRAHLTLLYESPQGQARVWKLTPQRRCDIPPLP